MKTILVVDDEYSVVEALRALLEDEGYRVTTAANGEEALQMLDTDTAPDLMLLDVMMPRMDGREVLRALQAHPERRALPVIVMSAASHPLTADQLGGAVFLQKPFDLMRLIRAIETMLRRHGERADGG